MRAPIVLVVAVVIALSAPAYGQDIFVWVNSLDPSGGDFMDSPPVLSGAALIDYVDVGSWSITMTDTGWPTDPVEREQYIWNTFYAPYYIATPPARWIGHFDASTQAALNGYFVDHTGVGTMVGVCSVMIQVDDLDGDGVLDEEEWCQPSSLSGAVILIREGTGRYDGYCGEGYYFGTRDIQCPDTYESFSYGVDIWLEPCPSAVENESWGAIKALYQ